MQSSGHDSIALTISNGLGIPKFLVGFRKRVTPGAAVPKTSINEYGEFESGKNEIGFAEDFLIPPPPRDFVPSEYFYQRQLCVPIPSSANPRHHLRMLGFAENICH